MRNTAQLEREMLNLLPAERERLALTAWESLEADLAFAANPATDPEAIALALERDAQIESGSTSTISHTEFLRRTGNAAG